MGLSADGFVRLAGSDQGGAWASAALVAAWPLLAGAERRHGGTWAPGVDLLTNAPDGSVAGVPLDPAWAGVAGWDGPWHPAQVSAVWPGYPGRDAEESDAAHRYRLRRDAAHVDGLLPLGPERRRYPREFHAFVLGIALTDTQAAPTVVWRGSHGIMRQFLSEAVGQGDPAEADVTEAYHAARRAVFETCERVELRARAGEAFLLHRFALHGTAPWGGPGGGPGGGPRGVPRVVAFFRPEMPSARVCLEAE